MRNCAAKCTASAFNRRPKRPDPPTGRTNRRLPRKRQQEQHPDLTLTGIYNVLEELRKGETLTAKEKTIHEQGLVSVLQQLHDELNRAVFEAYNWTDLADRLVGRPGATTPWPEKPDEQLAAEEKRGIIRWLRPQYQKTQRE